MVRRKPETKPFVELAETILQALDRAELGMSITQQVGDQLERLYINDAGARMIGAKEGEDLADLPPMMPIAPEHLPRVQEIHERWKRGEETPWLLELDLLHRDGARVPVEVAVASSEFRGHPATVAFLRDISERRHVEAELRKSEARFRQLAEAAPDAITVISEGKFVYANPAAVRALRFDSMEEFCARPLSALLVPEEMPIMAQRLARVAKGERLPPYEYRGIAKDGAIVTLEISSIAMEYEGKPASVSFGRTVDERKRMQADLLQADRMATVGTLASGIAHEINNPLTYLLLNLHRLRSRLPKHIADTEALEKCLELLTEALDGGERVRVIVKDLLAFARADDSSRKSVDARAVLESSIKLAQNVLRHRVTIEREFEDVPPVVANEPRLGQVFLNLLVNAAQAFEEDSIEQNRLRISLREAEYGFVAVEIEDNGCGIPEADLHHVFDPFFTTKPVGAGTGLGLAITRSIVDSFDGDIGITSTPGVGTRVRLLLPTSSESERTAALRAPKQPARRARILLVDDEPALANSLAEQLGDLHDVAVRTSSIDALTLLEEDGSFDLVLCDLIMPGLTGMDLYRKLCDHRPEYARRFVFITGGAFTPRAAEFVETTNARVLAKPFDPPALEAAIAAHLEDEA